GFVRAFIADDRLLRYATAEGIAATLARLSDRIARRMPRHAVRLEAAMPDLLAADAELAADFHAFYPELIAFADRCKAAGGEESHRRGGSGILRAPRPRFCHVRAPRIPAADRRRPGRRHGPAGVPRLARRARRPGPGRLHPG